MKAKYVKLRKEPDAVPLSPTGNVGSPRSSVQAEKKVIPIKGIKTQAASVGDRFFDSTPVQNYVNTVNTENDVIYETLNSSRLGETDKDDIRTRKVTDSNLKPRSPSPRLNTASSEKKPNAIFHKIASKTKGVPISNTLKHDPYQHKTGSENALDEPTVESRPESRTEEANKAVRDNYVSTTLHKKLIISPRLNTSIENTREFPATTTNAKQVSISTNFNPGTLAPPGSFIDRPSVDRPSTNQSSSTL